MTPNERDLRVPYSPCAKTKPWQWNSFTVAISNQPWDTKTWYCVTTLLMIILRRHSTLNEQYNICLVAFMLWKQINSVVSLRYWRILNWNTDIICWCINGRCSLLFQIPVRLASSMQSLQQELRSQWLGPVPWVIWSSVPAIRQLKVHATRPFGQ